MGATQREINYYACKIGSGSPFGIPYPEAQEYNEKGFDIYWTFQEFSIFGKRTKQDLRKIWAIAIEIDGDKEAAQKRISKLLKPSLVIESKNGYHIYWYLNSPIDCSSDPVGKADWYREFVKERVLPATGADPQAVDACRLLRVPMMRYWKDGKGEFMVDIKFDNEAKRYSLRELEMGFPKKTQEPLFINKIKREGSTGFWDRCNQVDTRTGLEMLSGTSHVTGERYTFKKQGKITRIVVNGKASNAWIDEKGDIGSQDGAGPVIPNWLHYFHKSWPKVADIMKQVFEIKE